MKLKFWLTLIFIIISGAFLRLYKVTSVPPHLSNDEISIAYDGYSLAHSGKDEHNHTWPLSFESWGDYKPPLYTYLLVPINLISKDNNLAPKIPSILAGIITILVLCFITILITGKIELGLIAAAVLSLTPWHIFTSRKILEANLALLFLAGGICLFLLSVSKQKISRFFLFLSSMLFALSIYGYHSERLLTPLLAILLTILYLRKHKKSALLFLGSGLLLIVPSIIDTLSHLNSDRATSQLLWNDHSVTFLFGQHGFIVKVLIVIKVFLSNYLTCFNPGILFFTGLQFFQGENPYQVGPFLIPFIVALIYGLFFINKQITPKHRTFFLIWFLISPIASAFSRDGYHILRALPLVLPLSVVISVGFYRLWLKSKILIILLTSLSFGFLLFDSLIYFYHQPREVAYGYQGYRPVAEYLKPEIDKGTIIKIDDYFGPEREYIGVPHLYFAYYGRWDPQILQNRKYTKEGVWYNNVWVSSINWESENIVPKTIYVATYSKKPLPENIANKLELVMHFVDISGAGSFTVWRGK